MDCDHNNTTKIPQFNTKRGKAILPNITSPNVMEICEVRYACPDDTYPVAMEDFANKDLDEIHIYIT